MKYFLSLFVAISSLFTSLQATDQIQPSTTNSSWILEHMTFTPDFPKEGIVFLWYGKLLKNPEAFKKSHSRICKSLQR